MTLSKGKRKFLIWFYELILNALNVVVWRKVSHVKYFTGRVRAIEEVKRLARNKFLALLSIDFSFSTVPDGLVSHVNLEVEEIFEIIKKT